MSVPNAPNDLRCSIVNGTVILTWQPPTSNNGSAIIGYNLYRGTTSGMEQFLIAVENLTSFTDANVMTGEIYYYQISAINGVGIGTQSSEVNILVPNLTSSTTNTTTTSSSNSTKNTTTSNPFHAAFTVASYPIITFFFMCVGGIIISFVKLEKNRIRETGMALIFFDLLN